MILRRLKTVRDDQSGFALVAVLILLLLEVILAWQFGHFSAVAGTQQQPPAMPSR